MTRIAFISCSLLTVHWPALGGSQPGVTAFPDHRLTLTLLSLTQRERDGRVKAALSFLLTPTSKESEY